MPRPTPLPPQLPPMFTVGDARALGVSRSRLRTGDLLRPHHGLRSLTAAISPQVAARQAAVVFGDRDVAFSHQTAARLLGMPLPTMWDPNEPLHVLTPNGGGRIRRPGVVAGPGLERRTTCLVDGLRVTDGVSTWWDLGSRLDVDALVVAGDWLLRPAGRSLQTPAQLSIPPRTVGAAKLREALTWIRPGSASPQETRTRLVLVRDGLPGPVLNADITTERGWVATVDLYWPEWGFALDYDGRHHRERAEQLDYDLDRARLIRSTGIRFEQVTGKHLRGRHPQVLAIVGEGLIAGGWRPAVHPSRSHRSQKAA